MIIKFTRRPDLDTQARINLIVFIYHLNGALGAYGQSLFKQGLVEGDAFSEVSRIEVPDFPRSPAELEKASRLFAGLNQIELNAEIVAQTIALRQLRKINIPDGLKAEVHIAHHNYARERKPIDYR
jgi:hypothetical protein